MAGIHITDTERAINWWRERSPSADGISACAEVRALAEVYALMVYYRQPTCDEDTMPARAKAAWLDWYAAMPDAPGFAPLSRPNMERPSCRASLPDQRLVPLDDEVLHLRYGLERVLMSLRGNIGRMVYPFCTKNRSPLSLCSRRPEAIDSP